ncbi:MAG: hypothetical protein OFPI_06910 [Osedax symbiont Rs2]|nr:MAG: hypothetical protein OFPI_06910 [Osedax symbiont Rs2]
MRDRLYNFALNRFWIVLLFAFLVVFATAYAAKNLLFNQSYQLIFFSDENRQHNAIKPLQDIYPKNAEAWQQFHSTRVNSVTQMPESDSKVAIIREKL